MNILWNSIVSVQTRSAAQSAGAPGRNASRGIDIRLSSIPFSFSKWLSGFLSSHGGGGYIFHYFHKEFPLAKFYNVLVKILKGELYYAMESDNIKFHWLFEVVGKIQFSPTQNFSVTIFPK